MSIYAGGRRVETGGKGKGRGTSFRRAGTEVKEDRQPANLTRPSRDFLVTPIVRPFVSFSHSPPSSPPFSLVFFFVLAHVRTSHPIFFSHLSIMCTCFKVA